MTERLASAAIIRNGETHSQGFREHWKIRAYLGDSDPTQKKDSDEEGFLTDTGRFVTREEARVIAVNCGQLDPYWWSKPVGRPMLSSDIKWE